MLTTNPEIDAEVESMAFAKSRRLSNKLTTIPKIGKSTPPKKTGGILRVVNFYPQY